MSHDPGTDRGMEFEKAGLIPICQGKPVFLSPPTVSWGVEDEEVFIVTHWVKYAAVWWEGLLGCCEASSTCDVSCSLWGKFRHPAAPWIRSVYLCVRR